MEEDVANRSNLEALIGLSELGEGPPGSEPTGCRACGPVAGLVRALAEPLGLA